MVAGDRLLLIYPEMTIGVLGGQVGEVGETIRNLARKYMRRRRLDDLMVGEDEG